MEENKTKKVSLTTILLIIAVIVIIIMACYIYAEKNNPNTTQEPQTQTDVVPNPQESEPINNNVNTKIENNDKQKIINLFKNIDDSDRFSAYFDVNKITYNNKEYTVEVEYNKPLTKTKDKLNELKKDKKITLNNETYEYIDILDESTLNKYVGMIHEANPNGYIQKNDKIYEILSNHNNEYVFTLYGTAGGYSWTINTVENMKFVANENTTIYDSFENKSYKLKDNAAKKWLNKSLEGIVRLKYSNDLGLSIFIDNK